MGVIDELPPSLYVPQAAQQPVLSALAQRLIAIVLLSQFAWLFSVALMGPVYYSEFSRFSIALGGLGLMLMTFHTVQIRVCAPLVQA